LPCPARSASNSIACLPHRRGLAKLEFALTVGVSSTIVALALATLSDLQIAGNEARRITVAAQQAAASAVHDAHCLMPHNESAPAGDCPPCPTFPSATPKPGTAPSPIFPDRSCPETRLQGVSP
jgi:hypothetical protein